MRHRHFIFTIYCLLFTVYYSYAQSILFPSDYLFDVPRQKAMFIDTSKIIHSSIQPSLYAEVPVDTLKRVKPGQDLFFDKVFYEDLIRINYTDKSSNKPRKFKFSINPVLNFTFSKDLKDTSKSLYTNNTRGFWIKGQIGEKFFFESSFFENQSTFPDYLRAYCATSQVVPGQGRWKTFKKTGFDYAMACGVLHYQPSKNFFVRLGTGKQKVGTGYRSLLLSDNAFNYPYIQFVASFFKQKLQYSQTYALLMNLSAGGTKTPVGTERIFQKKAASFQQLSWQINKKINVYLFQGLIWRATDSSNVMHLNPWYFNPVMGMSIAKYGYQNQNYIITGMGWEIKPLKKTSFYGQFMYDGKYLGKPNYGLQAGIKLFDAFKLKNVYLQVEYNRTTNTLYQNSNYTAQDYYQYGQVLTTPSTFANEFIGIFTYTYKKLFLQLKENYAFGTNSNTQNLSYFDAKLGYMINPCYKANISIGSTYRLYQNNTIPQEMQLFYISFKTSLYNAYYDF